MPGALVSVSKDGLAVTGVGVSISIDVISAISVIANGTIHGNPVGLVDTDVGD